MKIGTTNKNIRLPSLKTQPTRFKAESQSQKDEAGRATERSDNRIRLKSDIKAFEFKTIFALTDDNEVVIRVLNEKGEVIKQIPPEEFLEMVRNLKEARENLFSKKV